MKQLLFILLTTYTLVADALPKSIQTTITNIDATGRVQLATSVPKGMSGVVIHNYSNGLFAITHKIISLGNGSATSEPYTATRHENIPTVKTNIQLKDKVILGGFYNNALVIAPNIETYDAITHQFHKTWIHPDAYAVEFMKEGQSAISLESLRRFATINQVGLILIATREGLRILDPISQTFLGQLPLTIKGSKTLNPFFTRFQQQDASLFSFGNREYSDYYQAIKAL